MVENVARAILQRRSQPDFRELQDGAWVVDHDLELARAAIEAMREPTDAMLNAACEIGPDTNAGAFSYDDAYPMFRAMIDAALTTPEKA